jgi:hypothetical protein
MFILFLLSYIFALDPNQRKVLHDEDIRMARHLINEGITVTHPDYPFLKNENRKVPVKKHKEEELGQEDARMFRHLKNQGFTVN